MKAIRSFETSIGTRSHRSSVVSCCVGLRSSGLMYTPDVSNVPTEAVVKFVKCIYYIEVWARGGGVDDAALRGSRRGCLLPSSWVQK
jgi:hypothetical protein